MVFIFSKGEELLAFCNTESNIHAMRVTKKDENERAISILFSLL